MKFPKLIFSVSLLLTGQALGQADQAKANWQDSIVLLDVTRNNYNFRIPWDKRAQSVSKFGAVIEGKELLTTAAGLANHTLVRLQKGGRGKWANGEVNWIDYQANLAIIGVKDEEFWEGLKAIKFADANGVKEDLQVIRWRGGNIEKRISYRGVY